MRCAAFLHCGFDDVKQRTPLPVRHDDARRRADDRRRFLARRQAPYRRDARPARRRLCRGRLSGRESARHRILQAEADHARALLRLRHDQAAGPLGFQRSGAREGFSPPTPTRSSTSPRPGTITSMSRSAARSRRTSKHRRQREGGGRLGPRGDGRLRAFLRRLQGQPEICACSARRPRSTPARAGRCCATPTAARCPHEVERIVGEVAPRHSGRASSASTPTTTPATRSPIRSRPIRAGARQVQGTLNGLGERCGNANLVTLIPTLGSEARIGGALRDRRHAGGAASAHPCLARFRRDAQPRAEPVRALRRRLGLRHQGRHSRLRARQGPAHLRACRARERRQQARRARFRSGGALEPRSPNSTGSASKPIRPIRA